MACCMSLVGETLPLDVWHSALLPWFSQLCRDNNWRVRRAAAVDLPRLAGNLHRQQHRALHRADSTWSCSTSCASDECAGVRLRSTSSTGSNGSCRSSGNVCTEEGAACSALPAHCRTTGVVVEPLGVIPTGGCAHTAAAGAGYGARPGDLQRRSASSRLGASVWSAHVARPTAAGASGGAASMGKHPLSSSLLIDEPAGSASESPSSSLSSSDEQPLAGSPDGSAETPDLRATPDDECEHMMPAPAAEVTAADAAASALSGICLADCARDANADAPEGRATGPAPVRPPCALEQAPVLHACWAALRECADCLTADSSHWVKVTALSGLGPCLLALPPCQLSSLLIGRFVAMGSSTTVIYEISVALACAQSFGLVASRLGPHRWQDMRWAATAGVGL
jgi:hypothetical protein